MADPWEDFQAADSSTPSAPWEQFGGKAQTKQNKSFAADTVTDIKRGIEQIPGAITGISDIVNPLTYVTNRRLSDEAANWIGEKTGFQPSKWAKDAESEYSPERKASDQAIAKAWEEGGAGNIADAYLSNPRSVAGVVAQSLPSTIVGGAAGRIAMKGIGAISGADIAGLTKAAQMEGAAGEAAANTINRMATTAGAIGEGAITAGQSMDQVSRDADPRTAALSSLAAGSITGGIGKVSGRIANKLGLPDIETAMAGGGVGTGMLPWYKRIPASIAQESLLQELPQSAQEQVWQNIAEGKPWHEGVARQAIEGALAGAAMGGGVAMVPQGKRLSEQALPQEQQIAGLLPSPISTGTPGEQLMQSDVDRQNASDAAQAKADAIYAERDQFERERSAAEAQRSAFNEATRDKRGDPIAFEPGLTPGVDVGGHVAPGVPAGDMPGIDFTPTPLPDTGPLSRAANLSIASAAPQDGQRYFPFTSPQAAERRLTGRADRAGYEVAPHPTIPGRWTILPAGTMAQQAAQAANESAALRQEQLAQEETHRGLLSRVAGKVARPAPQAPRPTPEQADMGAQILAAESDQPIQTQAAPVKPEMILTKAGKPWPTKGMAAANAKKNPGYQPVQVQGGWALQLTTQEATNGNVTGSRANAEVAPAGSEVQGNDLPGSGNVLASASAIDRRGAGNGAQVDEPGLRQSGPAGNQAARESVDAAQPAQVASEEGQASSQEAVPQGVQSDVTAARRPAAAPIMRRNDLIGAIMRVTGGRGIAASMAQTVTGDTANRVSKLRGLFTSDGVQDLDDTATLLREEEGYDVRDGEHLAKLLRDAAAGDVAISMERPEREAESAKEKAYRNEVRSRAKKYGVKQVGRPFSDVEKDLFGLLEQRHNEAVAKLDSRSKDRYDAMLKRALEVVDYDEVDAIIADAQNRFSGRQFWNEATKNLRGYINDKVVEEQGYDLQETEGTTDDPDWLRSESKGPGGRGTAAEANAGADGQAGSEDFGLTAQTNEEAAAEFARQRQGEADLTKEQIDREAAGFSLQQESQPSPSQAPTGGQGGLFTADGRATAAAIQQARDATDTNPTEAQKKAGNYAKGKVPWNGLTITLENPKGSQRTGTGNDGEAWSVTMPVDYGYFNGFTGADKDHVDVFLGPNPESGSVWVINQQTPDGKAFDEHKVMSGFDSEQQAKDAYLASFSDGFGEKVFRSMVGPVQAKDLADILPKLKQKKEFAVALESAATPAGVIAQADAVEPATTDRQLEPVTNADRLMAKGQQNKIADFGEKIGGARKDKVASLGPRSRMPKAEDERPAWARKFHVMQLAAGRFARPEQVGKWQIMQESGGPKGAVKPASRSLFDTEQDALDAIPLVAVSQRHAAYGNMQDGQAVWGIYRNITDRKRALVKGGFQTRDEAMRHMAEHPAEILEHKFQFPERPWLDRIERIGPDRRTGDVTTIMFQETFGFRGGEFGNWNMGGDGQAALNHAYDALLDLADAIGVPPKAISLDGELAIAFGARGTGGKNSAAAHYEPGRIVINLTKIKGAGSAAHEWWHAVDHYFARNGGRQESDSVVAGGFPYNSTARPELMEAIKQVRDAMTYAERSTTTDADLVRQRAQKRIEEGVRSLDYHLNDLRGTMADGTYLSKGKKPATPAQLEQWDSLAAKLRDGDMGEDAYIENPSKQRGAFGFTTGAVIRDMNTLYKAVTGRAFLRQDQQSKGRQMHWMVKAIADNKANLAVREDVTTTSKGRSDFYIEAKRIDGYRTGDYWSSPEELGARAFESYIFDRLTAGQRRSDYLVYAVENRFYAALDMKPYPEGEERQRINTAFDNLFQTIEKKETGKGVALQSIASGQPAQPLNGLDKARLASVQRTVENFQQQFKGAEALSIRTVFSREEIPQRHRPSPYAEGVYHDRDGVIYLVARNLPTRERAWQVLMHETVGHYGLANLMGEKFSGLWPTVMDKARAGVELDYDPAPGEQNYETVEAVRRLYPEASDNEIAQEVLARMAETMNPPGWARVIIAQVRQWISRIAEAMGLKYKASLQDAKDMVILAAQHLRTGDNMISDSVGSDLAFASQKSGARSMASWLNNPQARVEQLRNKYQWQMTYDTDNGPLFVDHTFVLDPVRAIPYEDGDFADGGMAALGIMGHAAHVTPGATPYVFAIGQNGAKVGELVADVLNGDIVAIHDIEVYSKNQGLGVQVVAHIAANQYDDVRIIEALEQSNGFWKKVGINELDHYGNGRVNWEGVGEYIDGRPQQDQGRSASASVQPASPASDGLDVQELSQDEIALLEAQGFNFSRGLESRTATIGESKRAGGYTQDQKDFFARTGRTIEVPTLAERVQSLWKDAGKKLSQGLVDQFAPLKEFGGKAYTLARLSKGSAGAFEAMLHHGKLSIKDGAYDADTSGGVVEKLFSPLKGEGEDFLWWVAANRAEGLAAQDREHLFTPADIAAGKSLADGTVDFDYTLQHGPRAGQTTRNRALIYRDALKTFDEFNRNAMDMAEQSGLIDGSSRQFWETEFYVPFYRVSDEDGEFVGAKMGNALVRQQAFKHLNGGTDKLNSDLLANTLQNWAHLIDAAAKNRAAKSSLEAAARMGAAQPVAGTMAQYAASNGAMLPPGTKKTVWFMDGGLKQEYKVDDPYLLTAINSLEFAGLRGPLMDILSKFKHWLTIGVTVSPAFKVRNLIRDSLQAIGTAELSYNPVKNLAEGWKATDRQSQDYVSALASGGLIRFGSMLEGRESDRIRRLVERGVDESTILDSDDKWAAFRALYLDPAIDAYQEIGNRGEEINRAALYKQLTAKGMDHATASLMARDLMDFSLQGSWNTIRFLSQVVPFMNARLQGLYKLGRAAKEDPARFATVLGATALFSIALMAAYGGDDEWKKREDWDRDNNWWFKFGGVAFRIPKPFEIGAIATLAERGVEYFASDEMTGERFLKRVKQILLDNLSLNPVPQVAKPIIDLYANKDGFTGRPLETMGMEKLRPEYRFTQNTSMVARGLSTATGGVMSPIQIDHLVRGYFSWLGTFVVGGADMLIRPLTNEPTRPAADPWKFVSQGLLSELPSGQSRYVSQMYEQAQALEQAYGTYRQMLKEGKVVEAQAFAADHADEIKRYKSVEHVKKAESEFNSKIRLIERSSLGPDEKREKILEIQQMKDRVARAVAPGVTGSRAP